MNALQTYLRATGQDEFRAMNRLNDAGVISDECAGADTVAPSDADKAVEWLKENQE